MIDYIKYTVDGKTYELINNNDEFWSKQLNAPSVSGNYSLLLEISENGTITYIDSSDSRYDFYLYVITSAERVIYLQKYVPEFMSEVDEFKKIYEAENLELDKSYTLIEKTVSDMFIISASNEAITRIENFIGIKGQGSLEQRKYYIISLLSKGNKLSETVIKGIANAVTGSDCMVRFFTADELDNPMLGQGLIRVQVLSPEINKDYRYEDIFRALRPLVPAHLKLLVIKYFSLWKDIKDNYADWAAVASAADWHTIKNYIAPQ